MSDFFLTNNEIQALIKEEKKVSQKFQDFFITKTKKGHKESEIAIPRSDGSAFKVIIRQSVENSLDFSVILGYIPQNVHKLFILTRYNGKSHLHSNRIEQQAAFYDFHIHVATEQYQNFGPREEYYAETTTRYSNIRDALACLIKDCNLILPDDTQLDLLAQDGTV